MQVWGKDGPGASDGGSAGKLLKVFGGEMMKKKVLMAVVAAAFLSSSFSVYAAPQNMADGGVFDAEWYRGQNPDIDAAFPADASPEVLYEHYVVYGAKEGRLPFEGATPQGTAGMPAEGTPAEGTAGVPAEGTPAEGTEGVPAEGTPAEETTGVPAEGTPAEGTTGMPAEGTPAEGTAGVPAEGTPAEGTAGVPAEGTPAEGTEGVPAEGEPASETQGRVIDPSRPMVALTFDDGPYAPVGNQIMDCLAQYGGKATFYVVGERCAAYKDEMQRMVAEGHEIGNHTYSHKYLNKLGAAQIQSQIQRGNEAILAASGVTAPTVRLPGGNKNAVVLANVNAPMIMWNIDTLDWKTKDAGSTVNAVLGKIKDGDIVLMHELYTATGNAAVQIIPALVEQGYQLVTVSEMAQYRGRPLENGKVYYSFRP